MSTQKRIHNGVVCALYLGLEVCWQCDLTIVIVKAAG